MSIQLLIANVLAFAAFLIHTLIGDREIHMLEPSRKMDQESPVREKWTMARSGWHWVSVDLLFASILMFLINFSSLLKSEKQLLHILTIYFMSYGIVWLLTITISKAFPRNYLRLGQWILLWIIGGLIFWASFTF